MTNVKTKNIIELFFSEICFVKTVLFLALFVFFVLIKNTNVNASIGKVVFYLSTISLALDVASVIKARRKRNARLEVSSNIVNAVLSAILIASMVRYAF